MTIYGLLSNPSMSRNFNGRLLVLLETRQTVERCKDRYIIITVISVVW